MDALLSDPIFLMQMLGALVLCGMIAGVLAGLMGVGGGIVIVPVLYFFFISFKISPDVAMHVAVGTSLFSIVVTSISSVRSHHKKGAVDWGLLKRWCVGIVIGVICGTIVASLLSGGVLTLIFSILAFFVALQMLLGNASKVISSQLPGQPLEFIYSSLIGLISVMVGIGGGSLTVPVLTAYGYEMKRAVATSAGVGFIIALPGAIGFVISGLGVEGLPVGSIGYINLLSFMFIVPLSVLFAPLGAKFAHSLKPLYLRRGFGIFLMLTSIKMFVGSLDAF